MQTRKASTLSSLVLPHPPIPSRRSVTPHASSRAQTPLLFKFPSDRSTPRKSCDTGSWASSTQEADEIEWEWTKDQLSHLNKSLDNLPQHILTPYAGPTPPPNLLDRLARSITSSKGAMDWPHSVRATRVKLLDICRARAKSDVMSVTSIPEEKENASIDPDAMIFSEDDSTLGKTAGRRKLGESPVKRRKPLYRQSSMDFLGDLPGSTNSLARLSSRLQRSSKIINPTTSYHPYARVASAGTRTPSPSPTKNPVPNTIPRDRRPPTLRRATSISTTSSKGSLMRNMAPPSPTPSPRRSLRAATKSQSQQPLRMMTRSSTQPLPDNHTKITTTTVTFSEMMVLDPPATAKMKLKRAPSYAASSSTGTRPLSPGSSDEEEKARTMNAKRPRTRARTQSSGSTASGSTCVEQDKVESKTTSTEKDTGVEKKVDKEKEKEKEKTKLVVKKSKTVKTPEISPVTTGPLVVTPSLGESVTPTPVAKAKETPISSVVTSPRLRPRARPSVVLTPPSPKASKPSKPPAVPKASESTSEILSTSATLNNDQIAGVVAAAASVGLKPADGTRSKSRSRSISPTQLSHSVVLAPAPASPGRTLRRTAKTVFPKIEMQVKTLFGSGPQAGGGGVNRPVFTTVSNPSENPCLGDAFVLTASSTMTFEKVRKERNTKEP